MMEESLEAILALLDGSEPVTRETDWFTLRDARLQLRPYTHPRFEIAVAAQVSPAGSARRRPLRPRPAVDRRHVGRRASTSSASHWTVMEERAAEFGTDRRPPQAGGSSGPMHIAETEEQARKDVEFGLVDWVDYFQHGRRPAARARERRRRRAGRRHQRHRLRHHRHARHGRGPDPAPGRPVGRLRHVPVHGPRVGRPRGDAALLRAVRPRGRPAVPGLDAVARRTRGTGRRPTGPSSSVPSPPPS